MYTEICIQALESLCSGGSWSNKCVLPLHLSTKTVLYKHSVTQKELLCPRDKCCSQNPNNLLKSRLVFDLSPCMFISFCFLGKGNKMVETVDISRPWRYYFLDSKASFMHGNLWLLWADCESVIYTNWQIFYSIKNLLDAADRWWDTARKCFLSQAKRIQGLNKEMLLLVTIRNNMQS